MKLCISLLITLMVLSGCAAIAEHHKGVTWYQPRPSSFEFVQKGITVNFVSWSELQSVCLEYDAQALACASGTGVYLPERDNLSGSHEFDLRVQFVDWQLPYMVDGVLHVYDPASWFDQCEAGRLLAQEWNFDMGLNDACALGAEVVFHIAAGREDPPGGHSSWKPYP